MAYCIFQKTTEQSKRVKALFFVDNLLAVYYYCIYNILIMKIIKTMAVTVLISAYVLFMPNHINAPKSDSVQTLEEPAEQVVATPTKKIVKNTTRVVTKTQPKIVNYEEKQKLAKQIADTFPEEPVTMVAIALAESGLNPNKTGYNCRYTRDNGKSYVWACKVEDRHKAISTDGNILQQNGIKGGGSVTKHLEDVRIIYDRQGKRAWTVYKTGKYKEFLAQAENLLAIK